MIATIIVAIALMGMAACEDLEGVHGLVHQAGKLEGKEHREHAQQRYIRKKQPAAGPKPGELLRLLRT